MHTLLLVLHVLPMTVTASPVCSDQPTGRVLSPHDSFHRDREYTTPPTLHAAARGLTDVRPPTLPLGRGLPRSHSVHALVPVFTFLFHGLDSSLCAHDQSLYRSVRCVRLVTCTSVRSRELQLDVNKPHNDFAYAHQQCELCRPFTLHAHINRQPRLTTT
jgi:hypothetical protein